MLFNTLRCSVSWQREAKGRQRFGSSQQLSAFLLHCSWSSESNGKAAELWCSVQSLGRADVGFDLRLVESNCLQLVQQGYGRSQFLEK